MKDKLFKALITSSILLLIIINSKSHTNIVRTKLVDGSAFALKSFHNLLSASKRMLPFASLREENRLLRKRIELLTRQLEEMKSVSDENDRLKTLLNFKTTIPYTTMPAQVIGRDPSNWSNSLIIDKGSKAGIRMNSSVLSSKGLVGRVVEVGARSSKILLLTDPNSKVAVIIQRSRQGGILVGRPDGKCKMIYIALDSDVLPGDKVITAPSSRIFPKEILVGEVLKVDKEPGRLYKYAIVKLAQDLSRLEEVLCVR